MHPGWPARLQAGAVGLRPLRLLDASAWSEVRLRNEEWLVPWEGHPPGAPIRGAWSERHGVAAYATVMRRAQRAARSGLALPWAVTLDGRFVGQLTIQNMVRGALQSGAAGYWVDRDVAGRGVIPTALALAVDHCFGPARLHRVEVSIRPDNTPSRRVVEKLGFREEGVLRRFLMIDGGWSDHVLYALTAEDVRPDGLLARWQATTRG